ncbi:hypothetical protein [Oceanobacillus chungangensis]|nr:hypothetical protein [Oceanobacillus chungangensis]
MAAESLKYFHSSSYLSEFASIKYAPVTIAALIKIEQRPPITSSLNDEE